MYLQLFVRTPPPLPVREGGGDGEEAGVMDEGPAGVDYGGNLIVIVLVEVPALFPARSLIV